MRPLCRAVLTPLFLRHVLGSHCSPAHSTSWPTLAVSGDATLYRIYEWVFREVTQSIDDFAGLIVARVTRWTNFLYLHLKHLYPVLSPDIALVSRQHYGRCVCPRRHNCQPSLSYCLVLTIAPFGIAKVNPGAGHPLCAVWSLSAMTMSRPACTFVVIIFLYPRPPPQPTLSVRVLSFGFHICTAANPRAVFYKPGSSCSAASGDTGPDKLFTPLHPLPLALLSVPCCFLWICFRCACRLPVFINFFLHFFGDASFCFSAFGGGRVRPRV